MWSAWKKNWMYSPGADFLCLLHAIKKLSLLSFYFIDVSISIV